MHSINIIQNTFYYLSLKAGKFKCKGRQRQSGQGALLISQTRLLKLHALSLVNNLSIWIIKSFKKRKCFPLSYHHAPSKQNKSLWPLNQENNQRFCICLSPPSKLTALTKTKRKKSKKKKKQKASYFGWVIKAKQSKGKGRRRPKTSSFWLSLQKIPWASCGQVFLLHLRAWAIIEAPPPVSHNYDGWWMMEGWKGFAPAWQMGKWDPKFCPKSSSFYLFCVRPKILSSKSLKIHGLYRYGKAIDQTLAKKVKSWSKFFSKTWTFLFLL